MLFNFAKRQPKYIILAAFLVCAYKLISKLERNEDPWELSESYASSSEKSENKIELNEDDYNELKN